MCASLEQHCIAYDRLVHMDYHFMEVGKHAYQAAWGWWMQAGSVSCNQKFYCKWNLSFFKAVPPNRLPFYLGILLHIINSLSGHFRSWDYPEYFWIYSQFDRKSKTWFFTFFDVYVCWIERGKVLMSQLSPPNSGIV